MGEADERTVDEDQEFSVEFPSIGALCQEGPWALFLSAKSEAHLAHYCRWPSDFHDDLLRWRCPEQVGDYPKVVVRECQCFAAVPGTLWAIYKVSRL